MGNRIYGCDDCQLFCPWNKFARPSAEPDFQPRHGLDSIALSELADWSEEEFLSKTEGSAIRRIGHERFLRNVAVALGNADTCSSVMRAIDKLTGSASGMVREHADWARQQHEG